MWALQGAARSTVLTFTTYRAMAPCRLPRTGASSQPLTLTGLSLPTVVCVSDTRGHPTSWCGRSGPIWERKAQHKACRQQQTRTQNSKGSGKAHTSRPIIPRFSTALNATLWAARCARCANENWAYMDTLAPPPPESSPPKGGRHRLVPEKTASVSYCTGPQL